MMHLITRNKIFNVLFCVFLFFIVLSTDKVYAYEQRTCRYVKANGTLVAQQNVNGITRVYDENKNSIVVEEKGVLDDGCPYYLYQLYRMNEFVKYRLTNENISASNYVQWNLDKELPNEVEFDPNDQPEVNSCEDLIGEEVIDVIQEIFNWIRIAIPIIIIVMTIIDFSKSLFMDEESMKKSQKKFIKRLVIGIVIFFIPTLVMGILELINKIAEWNWIKAGICGLK